MITSTKISPKMINPRDIAEKRRRFVWFCFFRKVPNFVLENLSEGLHTSVNKKS